MLWYHRTPLMLAHVQPVLLPNNFTSSRGMLVPPYQFFPNSPTLTYQLTNAHLRLLTNAHYTCNLCVYRCVESP